MENMLPPRRWTDLLQQKLRHAGKAGHYRGAAKLVGLLVYLFHAGLAIGLIQLMVFGGAAVSVAWCARTVVHVALLSRFAQPTERYLLRYLPLIELLYIPYILFFTLIGGAGLYLWKPRAEFHNFVEACWRFFFPPKHFPKSCDGIVTPFHGNAHGISPR